MIKWQFVDGEEIIWFIIKRFSFKREISPESDFEINLCFARERED